MAYDVELTDTFGGEANYCWVRLAVVASDDIDDTQAGRYQAGVMRRAKAAVGMSGFRGTTERYGDGWVFRPYRMCQIMFVTWCDHSEECHHEEGWNA